MSYTAMFRKEENREIIRYLREHGKSTADQMKIDGITLRQKSMHLKKMFEHGLLTRNLVNRNTWWYDLTFTWKKKQFWWEKDV